MRAIGRVDPQLSLIESQAEHEKKKHPESGSLPLLRLLANHSRDPQVPRPGFRREEYPAHFEQDDVEDVEDTALMGFLRSAPVRR